MSTLICLEKVTIILNGNQINTKLLSQGFSRRHRNFIIYLDETLTNFMRTESVLLKKYFHLPVLYRY